MATQTAPADGTPTDSATSVSNAIEALLSEEVAAPAVKETASEPSAEAAAPEAEEPAAEPAAEPASEPAAPAAAEQGDDQFSELAEEAVSYYGMTQEEAERYGDLLPSVLARMDRQASLLTQREASPQEQSQQAQQAPPPAPAPAPKAEETRRPIGELGKFELPINREDHDEGTLKIFDTLQEVINEQRQTLNQHLEALRFMAPLVADTHETASSLKRRTESTADAEFASSMDEFFAKLPEEYADIYGKEPITQLVSKPQMIAARKALVAEMNTLAAFDAKGGRPIRGVQQQAARTLRALHADKEHKVATREASAQVAKQRERAIARPSGRGKAKGDDLASRRARAMSVMTGPLERLGIS